MGIVDWIFRILVLLLVLERLYWLFGLWRLYFHNAYSDEGHHLELWCRYVDMPTCARLVFRIPL